jgi:hypothetical protein
MSEMDVGVPEAGGYDAVVAWDDGGVCGNCDLAADRRDETIMNQNRTVIDGRSGGRDIDLCMFDGQSAAGKFEWGMRPMAGVELNQPDSGAGNDKENQYRRKKTKQPPAHRRTSSVEP